MDSGGLQQTFFKAKLSLNVRLTHDDMESARAPNYYCEVPRISYLPSIIDKLKEHFKPYAVTQASWTDIWFSYNKEPLRWFVTQYDIRNVPIGVLFDLECGELKPEQPWTLIVHFRNFPSDKLLPYEGWRSFHNNFMHSLKEATCIMRRSPEIILKLSTEEQLILEEARDSHSYSHFCDFSKIILAPEPERLPIRIFSKVFSSFAKNPFSFIEDCPTYNANGTLKALLVEIIPALESQKALSKAKVRGVQVSGAYSWSSCAFRNEPSLLIFSLSLLRPFHLSYSRTLKSF